jgi:uncharacterized sulfatase
MPLFRSMVAKAETGDPLAKRLVRAYHHRPAVELFDMAVDPLEMNNLAGQPNTQKTEARLRQELAAWMTAQGDQGVATEMKALKRQRATKARKKD